MADSDQESSMGDPQGLTIMDLNNDPSSPYYLNLNKNPALVLVSSLLIENNYHSWSRSMRNTLVSKKKMKFLNGIILIPYESNPTFKARERCNTMLLSLISRAFSRDIVEGVSMLIEQWVHGTSWRLYSLNMISLGLLNCMRKLIPSSMEIA